MGIPGQDEGRHAGHDAAGRARRADLPVTARRDRRGQADSRGGQRRGRPRAAERGQGAGPAGGSHRDHPRVGGRVVHDPRALSVVARGCHQQHALAQCVGDGRPLGRAAARRGGIAAAGQAQRPGVEGQVDDPGATIDRVPDACGDARRQTTADGLVRGERIVEFQRDPDREDLRGRCHASQARPAAVPGDEAGHRRALDAPVGAARLAAQGRCATVIRPGDHRAGQARVAGVHAGAEDRQRYPGSLGLPPRLRHLQIGQPPFLGGGGHGRRTGRGPQDSQDRQQRRQCRVADGRNVPRSNRRDTLVRFLLQAGQGWAGRHVFGQPPVIVPRTGPRGNASRANQAPGRPAAVIDTRAPGGRPSCWAASPPFTAMETSPALSA